jgi:hypothetical protein
MIMSDKTRPDLRPITLSEFVSRLSAAGLPYDLMGFLKVFERNVRKDQQSGTFPSRLTGTEWLEELLDALFISDQLLPGLARSNPGVFTPEGLCLDRVPRDANGKLVLSVDEDTRRLVADWVGDDDTTEE